MPCACLVQGDHQLTLDPVRGGLLIAHGLGDSAAVRKMANDAACIRMMTPAVPVALEMCQGSADGEDHKLGAKMGTVKGGRASATTKRVPVLQAACGRAHTILLQGPDESKKDPGAIRVYGDNHYGQLGLGHRQGCMMMTSIVPFFQQPRLHPVSTVAAGADFCMVLLQDGRLFAWGNNRDGQLGVGILAATVRPLVRGDGHVELAELVPGGALACAGQVSARDGIVWFQSTLPGYARHTVGEGDWQSESTPLGIWGHIEEELEAFACVEQQQIERMERRKDRLERELRAHYEAAVSSDQAVLRNMGEKREACQRQVQAVRVQCAKSLEAVTSEWLQEADDLLSRLLLIQAMALGR